MAPTGTTLIVADVAAGQAHSLLCTDGGDVFVCGAPPASSVRGEATTPPAALRHGAPAFLQASGAGGALTRPTLVATLRGKRVLAVAATRTHW